MTHGHCTNCKFWEREQGLCKRFPPQVVPQPSDNQHPVIYWPVPMYPNTRGDDWCGEHQLRGP